MLSKLFKYISFKTLLLLSVYKTILRCNSIITWEIFSNDNTTNKGIPEKWSRRMSINIQMGVCYKKLINV